MSACDLHEGGRPAGYRFQMIGKPVDDLIELLCALIGKMGRALTVTHVQDTDHGPEVKDRLILRGTV